MNISSTQRIDPKEIRDTAEKIRLELRKFLVGQEEMIEFLLAALLADGHVLLEGVPGVAKTLTAKLFSRTLDVQFQRIQFTPDLMPSDVLGTSVFNPKTVDFEFRSGPVFSNFLLIDEINRAPAKTQSALFEAMEERQASIDGVTYPLPPPFIVVATQNPIDQEGTYRLPEAQLDRFLFKITVGYPSISQEIEILRSFHERDSDNDLSLLQPVIDAKKLTEFRGAVRKIHVQENIMEYIADIIVQTRGHSGLLLGGSPRASLGIMMASKAFAALDGRDFIIPDDVKKSVEPVLGHRLMLTPEKEMEGVGIGEILRSILNKTESPR